MPKTNDILITKLRQSHLNWGSHRHTNTRGVIYGEGYLQIPIAEARRLNITNNNLAGVNCIYTCTTSDGFLNNVKLLAAGGTKKGAIYAKQLQGSGNLKLLGDWFNHINANVGDRIEVRWTSPSDIIVTKL